MSDEPTVGYKGKQIECARCDGFGMVESWPHMPDECPDCNGSGCNWQYPNGAIAKYYSGPFLCGAPHTSDGNVDQ